MVNQNDDDEDEDNWELEDIEDILQFNLLKEKLQLSEEKVPL